MNVRWLAMINAEKFKKELRNINMDTTMFERWGFDTTTDKFRPCGCIVCKDCVMYDLKDEQEQKNYVGCNHARMRWLLSEYVEPITLTEFEYNILKYIADNTRHMYIARDKQGSLYLYDAEPNKGEREEFWVGRNATQLIPFNKLFRFIMWEDEEAYTVKGILKHCRVIDKNIVVHKVGE